MAHRPRHHALAHAGALCQWGEGRNHQRRFLAVASAADRHGLCDQGFRRLRHHGQPDGARHGPCRTRAPCPRTAGAGAPARCGRSTPGPVVRWADRRHRLPPLPRHTGVVRRPRGGTDPHPAPAPSPSRRVGDGPLAPPRLGQHDRRRSGSLAGRGVLAPGRRCRDGLRRSSDLRAPGRSARRLSPVRGGPRPTIRRRST